MRARSVALAGACIVLLTVVLPATSGAAALLLSPQQTYPLYSIGQVVREPGSASKLHPKTVTVTLSLRADPPVSWVVQAPPQVERFELIEPGGRVITGGMDVPFSAREPDFVRPTLAIPSELLDGKPFRIRVTTSTELRVPELLTMQRAHEQSDANRTAVFFFIGFFLAVGLIFAVLYLSLGDFSLLLFVAVMGSLVFFEIVNYAYAWQYLWPNARLDWHLPNALVGWAYFLCLGFFCRNLLRAQGTLVWFERVMLGLLAVWLPIIIAQAYFHDSPGVPLLDEMADDAFLLTVLAWAIASLRAGQRPARFFILAFSGVALGNVINSMAINQFIPASNFTEWIFEIGMSWQAIMLSLAVAAHLQDTARENALLNANKARLEALAMIDGLTGISNRRAFDQRLSTEWNRACRTRRPLALLFIDVDNFKNYNDVAGHLAGDDCLRRVAETLAKFAMRSSDCCARYGGEEFAVILPEATEAQALALAEQMRSGVRELSIPNAGSACGHVTISVGIAVCVPSLEDLPTELLAAADRALYDAKRSGRDRIVTADFVTM